MRVILICNTSFQSFAFCRTGPNALIHAGQQTPRALGVDLMKLTFTGSRLDHAGLKRTDRDWVEARRQDEAARAVLFAGGNLAVNAQGEPLVLPASQAHALKLRAPGLIYLGEDGRHAWFAGSLERGQAEQGPDFRVSAMHAEADFACVIGRARAILQWHARRRFCSNCGAQNAPADGGMKLVCPSCGMQHFPRVDPSVIMLPYHGDRCVMGRQANWPPGMFATLAGFIEPGETIEAACARETREEIGLNVVATRYVASQPWPFPSALMIGLLAEIEPGEVRPDDDLEDARWFTRDEARALYEGDMARWAPPHFSISRQLIDLWLSGATT